MNDRSVFHLIFDLVKKEGISCVLIGGYAVNHHRVTRQTNDVDFLITENDFRKIADALKKAGYKQTSAESNFAQLTSGRVSLLE